MADDEKAHQKRLKEARKVLEKSYKLYQDGKIDQDELKERLRPYKAELVELNLVKASKTDQTADGRPAEAPKAPEAGPIPPSAETVEKVEVPVSVRGRQWTRRSNLTLDEIKRKVDQLGSSGPSEGLKESYRSRYGEDLAPPLESVTFQVAGEAMPEQAPAPDPQPEQPPAQQPISERSKGFLKSLFNKKNT